MDERKSLAQAEINLHEYISFSEALELFKPLDKNGLMYRSRNKEIATIEEDGKTRYRASDVVKTRDKLLQKRKVKRVNKKDKPATEVDWQKISDLPAILKLDITVYKEHIVGDIGLYISWERKNPKITLLSFEEHNRENVLAYLSLVPLPEEVIMSILKGEREELSIKPDEVEDYERKGAYTLLAESVVVHPDHPEQLNAIIKELLNFWCSQYPDRYIDKIYAQAASDDGDILIRKLYFSPLYNIANNAYVLDLQRPGVSKLVKNFQACLENKQNQLDPA